MNEYDLKAHLDGLCHLADRYREVVEDLKKKAAAQNYPHELIRAYAAVLREIREIQLLP